MSPPYRRAQPLSPPIKYEHFFHPPPSPRAHSCPTIRPTVLLLAKALLVPLASAAPLSLFHFKTFAEDGDEPPKDPSDPGLWIYLSVAMALVLLGGIFAGLTIALMGQDETYLQVIATSGEGSERKHATKVLNLLKKGKHWVLVTLLLSNVITNETLPIVLDRSLGGGWPAVLSSTVLIVIFGEIVPQSICVRYGLSIGAMMSPFVLLLMWIMCPVAWPTAKLLDWLLGADHGTMYKKAGLKTLVQLHKTLGTTPGERLMEDEVTIINSVLDLKEKPVGDIMTPMQDVFIMSADTVLDESMMDTILSQGYSRIPIYAPDNQRNFIGMLLVKILITYDPEDAKRVRDFSLATLPETQPYTSCLDIINFFQEGKSHMVLVSDFPGQDKGALGVVTLEDVIEEVIGEEIIDESDVFVDVHKAIRRMAPAPQQKYVHKKRASLDPIINREGDRDAKESEPLLGDANRKSSWQTPNGTLMMRRKSSTASEGVQPTQAGIVPVRTNNSEMREHLRHLGPSNLASKPRATKFSNVKIKPGVGTIPENQQTTKGTQERSKMRPMPRSQSDEIQRRIVPNRSATVDGTEASKLLRSAGRDASDGAAALRAGQGYGTLSSSGNDPTQQPPSSSNEDARALSAGEASRVAEQKAASPEQTATKLSLPEGTKVPGKVIVGSTDAPTGEEDDQVGEMVRTNTGAEGVGRSRSKSSRGVRSGSITETEVETIGGMKKVVLDISEESEEGAEETTNGRSSSGSPDDDDDEESNPTTNRTRESTSNEGDGKKRRRKRGKRKPKGDGN